MSQQGEDDWWDRLYEASALDTGPTARPGDTLDARFESVSDAVIPSAPEAPAPTRPRAWWDADPAAGPRDDPWAPEAVGRAEESWPPGSPDTPGWPGESGSPVRAYASQLPVSSVAPRVPEQPDRHSEPGPAQGPEPVARPGGATLALADLAGRSVAERRDTPAPAASPLRSRAPWEPPVEFAYPQASARAEPADAVPRDAVPTDSAPTEPPRTAPTDSVPAHSVPTEPTDAVPRDAVPVRAVPDRVAAPPPGPARAHRPRHFGAGPPAHEPEPATLPAADPGALDRLVPDTVLDGAHYGSATLRAVSARGDAARHQGEPRRDAILTARFGTGDATLVLVAVASGSRGDHIGRLAADDACRWIGGAVGRSHARLSDDLRAGRRGDLRSGLHRLTGRAFGKLRATAAELGVAPGEYTAGLRCLLLSGDPECRTRVFFGVGPGGLFRLRDGVWHDIEPALPEADPRTGGPAGGAPPCFADSAGADPGAPVRTPGGDVTTVLGTAAAQAPAALSDPHSAPPGTPPRTEPFRFRASVARPGDTLLLCGPGLADPMRGESTLAAELAERWTTSDGPPDLADFLAATQLRVAGYAADRTAAAVWEA